jgi:hypothetical protein
VLDVRRPEPNVSHETIVYGFIEGATWKPPEYRRLQAANLEVLDALPKADSFPPVTRDMFSCTPLDSPSTFRAQVIHFGGSMNGLDFRAVPEWVAKFEALLSKLYWFEATAHVWTDYIDGAYQFWWKIGEKSLSTYQEGDPQPTTTWERKHLHLVRSLDEPPNQRLQLTGDARDGQ